MIWVAAESTTLLGCLSRIDISTSCFDPFSLEWTSSLASLVTVPPLPSGPWATCEPPMSWPWGSWLTPMEASLAVPQRKAMSSVTKMKNILMSAIARANGYLATVSHGRYKIEKRRTYSAHPGARQGDPSSSIAGSRRWIKAVAIWKCCVGKGTYERNRKTYDHTAAEIFGEIKDRFGDRKPLRPTGYYGEERSKHGSHQDDEYGSNP